MTSPKPRFSLRFLLVVMATCAVLCWFLWPMNGGITEEQASAVKLGMYPDEVAAVLDRPPTRHGPGVRDKAWGFPFAGPMWSETGRLVVEFGGPNGTVVKISRTGRVGAEFAW